MYGTTSVKISKLVLLETYSTTAILKATAIYMYVGTPAVGVPTDTDNKWQMKSHVAVAQYTVQFVESSIKVEASNLYL